MSNILAKLAAPFPPERISWRVGPTNKEKTKGIALAYIDARDVMERLDAVMGADWQCEYTPVPHGHCCRVGLLIEGHWRWRSNGAVNMSDSDKTDAKEMAEKGSYSDAFKRAAVLWGVGRYLYDIEPPWVEIRELGRSYVIADSAKPLLLRVLGGSAPTPAPTPTPTPAQETRTDWDAWMRAAKEAVAKKTEPAAVEAWKAKNDKAIKALEDARPALYRELVTFCSDCVSDLERAA